MDIERLDYPAGARELLFALVNPVFEAPTREMRAVLPREVPLSSSIRNCCMGGSLVRSPGIPLFSLPPPLTVLPLKESGSLGTRLESDSFLHSLGVAY